MGGPKRMERFMTMLLVREQELWAWSLLHVQTLDLDLHGCDWSTLDSLQKMLMRALDVKETLQRIRLRRVPVFPSGEAVASSKSAQNLVVLVNPIMANFPAASRASLLLLPHDLGQLRLRLAAFCFRLGPARDGQGKATKELDLIADRSTFEGAVFADDEPHVALLQEELGDLRQLPQCDTWATSDFAGWSSRLLLTYKKLLSDRGKDC